MTSYRDAIIGKSGSRKRIWRATVGLTEGQLEPISSQKKKK
jgi:hypothetical protein